MRAGWKTTRLGDALTLKYGKPLLQEDRDPHGKYPAYGANGIRCRTDRFYSEQPGIVIGRKGSAGEVKLTDGPFWPLDVTYFVEFDDSKYDLTFLYYLLTDLDLPKLAKGVKPGINRKEIYNIEVAFPTLAEQERVAAILDESFEAIDEAVADAEKNLVNAREVFASYLNSIFTNNAAGWVEKELGELASIKHGFAFKSVHFASAGDYVLLTPGNFFEDGGYRDRGDKQKYYVGEIPEDYILREGAFLIAMTEQAAGLLGSPAIVPENNRFLHNQRLGLVQPRDGVAWSNDFFFHAFNTKRFRQEVHATASGVKVRHTSPKKLSKIVLSFPPTIAEQQAVGARLERCRQETSELQSIYRRKLAGLSELKQSILRRAFAGELSSQRFEGETAA